jgi:hypothetical protein
MSLVRSTLSRQTNKSNNQHKASHDATKSFSPDHTEMLSAGSMSIAIVL